MSLAIRPAWVARAMAATGTWLWLVPIAVGASPTPSPAAGDPRSAGEGPGLVGEPVLAIGVVIVIGLTTALVTAAWVRFERRRGAP